jgi:hypothetical protein
MVRAMTSSPSVPRRVVDRALIGLWRQKKSVLLYAGGVVAMVGYLSIAGPAAPTGTPVAASAAPAPDCADAVMSAVVGRSAPAVQSTAYQCLGPDLQQRVFKDGFASQYQTIASTAVRGVSRVGTHAAEDGAELVYYAVDAGDQSVPFVVQLGADGKVLTIQ